MSARKPPGVPWESFIDRQIREAQQRGDFDGLPGTGKPLADLDRRRDDLWWVRRKLKDEHLSTLPPTLQIRKDVDEARAAIERAPSEAAVRDIVRAINARIIHVNRTAVQGPPSTVMPLDEERAVARWREGRAS